MTKTFIATAVSVLASLALTIPVMAQGPTGPVTMIVPFTVGGLTDLTARFLVDKSKSKFPDGIAVLNRTGGGGSIGVTEIVQAKPDGTTIGLAPTASIIDKPQMNKLPYKTPDDYVPIMNTITYYQLLAVRGDAPWKSAKDLLAAVRKKPGKLRFGTSGIGTASYLNLVELINASGIKVIQVPFSGWAEGSTQLLGGHIDALIINPGEGRQLTDAGRIKILAIFAPQRSPFYPNAPTMKELGYNAAIKLSFVVIGPKNLSPGIKDYFRTAFKDVLDSPAFKNFAKSREVEVNYLDSKDTRKMLWSEYRDHTTLLKSLDLLAK